MGKTESKIIHTIPEETLQSYEAEYKILGLTSRDICLLHNIFREILHDDDEVTIQLEDLLNYFSLEKTSLTKLIFTSFDIDLLNIGAIDFPRFLQGLWNFCTLEDDALSYFIFNLYDVSREDYLQRKVIASIIGEMYGSKFSANEEAVTTQKNLENMKMRYVDAHHFSDLCEQNPAILYPAITLKSYFRKRILGERFWKSLVDHRKHLYSSKNIEIYYVPVRVLLVADKDPRAIAKYLEKRENINPMRVATLRSMSRLHSQRSFSIESTPSKLPMPTVHDDGEPSKPDNNLSNQNWKAAKVSPESSFGNLSSKKINNVQITSDGVSSKSTSDDGRETFLRRSIVIGVQSKFSS